MGSGVSMPDGLHVTIEEKLKEEYNKLINEGNLTEQEIKDKLSKIKDDLLSKYKADSLSSKIKQLPNGAISEKPPLEPQKSKNSIKETSLRLNRESSTRSNKMNSNNVPKLNVNQPKSTTNATSSPFTFHESEIALNTILEEKGQKSERKNVASTPTSTYGKLVRKRSFNNNKNGTKTPTAETPRKENSISKRLSPRVDLNISPKNIQKSSSVDSTDDQKLDTAEITRSPSLSSPTAVTKIDNWDSVTELPFCIICKMSFKSVAFLDRHIKFSEVHQKNIEDAQQSARDTALLQSNALSQTVTSKGTDLVLKKLQEEGVDYRLVYSGSKFFWRTQDNIDFHIYHHVNSDVVEVISFDNVKDKELNRLYFQFKIIANLIEEEVNRNIDLKYKELAIEKNAVIPSRDILYPQIQRNCLATYLLSRLQVHEGKITFLTSIGLSSTFSPSSDAQSKLVSPLLNLPPNNLVPVSVDRRRKTNSHQYTNVLVELSNDLKQMSKSTLENISEVGVKEE
uniref:Uncharacterized protein n=1 Tax=Chromulina nebulosa TaxID=96789 RepID=A0A7S0XDU4_9STRA|mmetsp:Transcript_474/g.414  ORF Transcript_474/g.414 Transcript_474/m.414 type:complete len:511 (+) Transcript_474:90-1622(+)